MERFMQRLPIYRFIDQPVELFGLSLLEICLLCLTFLALSEFFSQIRFASLFVLAGTILLALILRLFRRKFSRNYLAEFVRFCQLPDFLPRKIRKTREKKT